MVRESLQVDRAGRCRWRWYDPPRCPPGVPGGQVLAAPGRLAHRLLDRVQGGHFRWPPLWIDLVKPRLRIKHRGRAGPESSARGGPRRSCQRDRPGLPGRGSRARPTRGVAGRDPSRTQIETPAGFRIHRLGGRNFQPRSTDASHDTGTGPPAPWCPGECRASAPLVGAASGRQHPPARERCLAMVKAACGWRPVCGLCTPSEDKGDQHLG